jgi:hypothetical protein
MKKKEKEEKPWDAAAEIRAEQREALKNMPFRKKVAYYWEYYRWHVLVTIAVVAVIVSSVAQIVNQKPYSFYAIMLNSYDLDGGQIAEDFAAYADLDTENFTCFIDTLAKANINVATQNELAELQRIMALAMVGDLDVLVADSQTFLYYGYALLYEDLRELLTAEELAAYEAEGRLFYIDQAEIDRRDAEGPEVTDNYRSEPTLEEIRAEAKAQRDHAQMGNPVPIGIFMNEAPLLTENGSYEPFEPVFGFVISSGRLETARLYLEFLDYAPSTKQ